MPNHVDLEPSARWRELRTTPDDWSGVDPAALESMLVSSHLIRAFEEKVLELAGSGARAWAGPFRDRAGGRRGRLGALALRASDQINGSHRAHHQFLAKALHYRRARRARAGGADFPADIANLAHRTLAEILGLAQGFCQGRGGSMHLRWAEAGNLGTNAIVGGGVPLAAGAAWAHKRAGTGDVAVTYFGDGAINIGSVLETMNLAAAWKLPLCFFIENNRYAVATDGRGSRPPSRGSPRAGSAFGIPAWQVDGMDPLAVHLATQEALEVMRDGGGPTIIEADVYRYFHQNGPLPGSAFGYRNKEEEAAWRGRDPLDRAGRGDAGAPAASASDAVADLRQRARPDGRRRLRTRRAGRRQAPHSSRHFGRSQAFAISASAATWPNCAACRGPRSWRRFTGAITHDGEVHRHRRRRHAPAHGDGRAHRASWARTSIA